MAQDLRGRRLAAFDDHCREFLDEARCSVEAGESLAREEIEGLTTLADHVVQSLGSWRERANKLELSLRAPFNVPVAARAVAETVFDDVLRPEATRLFSAAIDLAL
ncbi:MAG: hypothetical protein JO111_00510 [Caulobacteraceae bacterium]|nr:hypothetical protein [Caulobacteraceae bacterium]